MTTHGKAGRAICCLLGLPPLSVEKGCSKAPLPLPPASVATGQNLGVGSVLVFWLLSSGVVWAPGLPKPDSFVWLFGCSYLENRS